MQGALFAVRGGRAIVLPFERIEPFIVALRAATDLDTIRHLVDIEVQALGFDRYAYVQLRPPKGVRERIWFGTYPDDWARHYADHDLRLHDPVWGRSFDAVLPFLWEDVQARDPSRDALRLVYGPGADAGLRAGAGVPLHGPRGAVAALQVANDAAADGFRALFEAQRGVLQLLAYNVHARVIELTPIPAAPAVLSPRQKEVLLWMIRGKTNWEIGELLQISEDTVRQHVIKISRQLGASNRTQAAALAITRGLVVP